MELEVDIAGSRYRFLRPVDLESVWEQMSEEDLGEDERIPYWVEIWPASIMLATWIRRNHSLLAGQRCLDVGCGLGLSAMIAAETRAEVLGLDYDWAALDYARRSAVLNRISRVTWVQMDWRRPGFKSEAFSFIWGADIIYERRFFHPLIELFEGSLIPGGRIWLASPERNVSLPFWDLLQERGWTVGHLQEERIDYREYKMRVVLWEIRKPERACLRGSS